MRISDWSSDVCSSDLRWFCRLGLEDAVPDHSTFSKNRHGRFRESGIFRWVFDEVVRRCMAAGLVKAEGFAVDASIIAAAANKQRSVPGTDPVDWSSPALSTRAERKSTRLNSIHSCTSRMPSYA